MLFQIDPLYWMIMAPVLLLSLYASFKVKNVFSEYSKERNSALMTGAEVAEALLERNGLSSTIQVVESKGFLSDHYDPTKKIIKLSPEVYNSPSIAAMGVAAHETGHAIQHAKSYAPLVLRNMMVPLASIGSNLSWIIIIAGFLLQALSLIKFGILLFSLVVIFQIITLPVEFNASRRAKLMLSEYGIVPSRDIEGVSRVLTAAALTYVAAAASSIATLLYFLLRSGLIGGRDD
jgi:Zn-dependent membrane protease YugP